MAKAAARPKAEPKTPRPGRARAPKNGSSGELLHTEDDIRLRAYHLYLERGAVDGADFDDWLTAEKELKVAHN